MLGAEITRRDFIKGSGALIVGFSLAGPAAARAQGVGAPQKPQALDQVDSFLAIAQDGTVTLFTGKVDLGTKIRTALRQIVAEELDVPFERISLIEGDTMLCPDQGPTFGSLSIQIAGVQIRRAAATARKALVEMAAQRLGVKPGEVEVRYGVVRVKADPTKNVAYNELIGDREFRLKVDKNAPLKDPKTYTIVGKPVPSVDTPAKVTGTWTYIHDFRVPGMLHGRVIRPPAIGATLQSVDESSVRGIKGLVKVVRIGNFLGVVAETEWAAIKAARQLKATWSVWEGLPEMDKLYQVVRSTPVGKDEVTLNVGDARAALAGAPKTYKATYEFGIHLHGSIGPSCAVADVKNGQAVIWSSSQAGFWLRKQLAHLLGMPERSIRVMYLEGAACFGRNAHEDAAADAALLSRAVGRPVRVQWMREDEHGWEPNGPPTLVDLKATLDPKGNITAWLGEFWHPRRPPDGVPPVPLLAGFHAGMPEKDVISPGRIDRNSAPPYTVPNAYTVVHWIDKTPFRCSWIRTPGRMQNTFANETFMDELAAAAGVDPVEFRLRHLKDPRGIECLKAVVAKAKWDPRPSPKKRGGATAGAGRGVSYVKYENVRTYVACVAEVEAERNSGAIRVKRVVVSHDCGQIINPDGVRAQIEGCVVQTVSRTLKEAVKWNRSQITTRDWASYPIITFPEIPEVEMVLIDRPTEPPWGVGEPAATVIPSAISNAVFDAIGVRLRTVPFTPDRVKAAIQAQA